MDFENLIQIAFGLVGGFLLVSGLIRLVIKSPGKEATEFALVVGALFTVMYLIMALSAGLWPFEDYQIPTHAAHLARPALGRSDENLLVLEIALTSAGVGALFFVLMMLVKQKTARIAIAIFMWMGLCGALLFLLIFMIKGS